MRKSKHVWLLEVSGSYLTHFENLNMRTVSTAIPHGCEPSPLLYTDFTHDCMADWHQHKVRRWHNNHWADYWQGGNGIQNWRTGCRTDVRKIISPPLWKRPRRWLLTPARGLALLNWHWRDRGKVPRSLYQWGSHLVLTTASKNQKKNPTETIFPEKAEGISDVNQNPQ